MDGCSLTRYILCAWRRKKWMTPSFLPYSYENICEHVMISVRQADWPGVQKTWTLQFVHTFNVIAVKTCIVLVLAKLYLPIISLSKSCHHKCMYWFYYYSKTIMVLSIWNWQLLFFPVISCLDLLDFAWLLNTCPYSGYDAGFDCSVSSREIIDIF